MALHKDFPKDPPSYASPCASAGASYGNARSPKDTDGHSKAPAADRYAILDPLSKSTKIL